MIKNFFCLCVAFIASTSFGDFSVKGADFQINIRQTNYDGIAELVRNDGLATSQDYLQFSLKSYGITAHYIYSPFTSIGTSAYIISSCEMQDNSYGASCSINDVIQGTSIDLLTGYNLNKDGIYIYTGVRYYWEFNDNAKLGSPTIPVGLGLRFKNVSAEISIELRDSYSDFDSFDILENSDGNYIFASPYGATAEALPIHFSLGYKF